MQKQNEKKERRAFWSPFESFCLGVAAVAGGVMRAVGWCLRLIFGDGH